jgi:hypothetical protein
MEPYLTREGESLALHGLPDTVKIIALEGALARHLADLTLHQTDLHFADDCLDAINFAPADLPIIREGLWRSAIVHVMKCFGSSASRSSLPEKKILKGHSPEAAIVFDYFKNLRHKFIVHDENAWSQAIPCAGLNDGSKEQKVEGIVCLGLTGQTLDEPNYANLKLLIRTSLIWTATQFDEVKLKIKAELEKSSYDDLARRHPPSYRAPQRHEVANKRKTV